MEEEMKFIVLFFLFPLTSAWSYTNFIGYGYTSCTACHYNPFGGGPINDYGRVVAATAISGKPLSSISDTTLEKYSGFLGNQKLPQWVRPSIDYRGLRYYSDFREETERTGTIHMNIEANIVLLYGEKDQFHYSYSVSKYPQNTPGDNDGLVTRENYVGWRINQNFGLQAGLFDTVYGLKIPDHLAYSRSLTGLAQNDQTLGGALYTKWGKFEGGGHIFVGNPNEEDNEKQKGLSLTGEFEFWKYGRLGASFLQSSSEFLDKTILGFHLRQGFKEGSSLISEIGRVTYAPATRDERSNFYGLVQGQMRLFRGMHFLSTFEWNSLDSQDENESTVYRFGPGLQWFPVQRLELRSELLNSRTFNSQATQQDSWVWYTNLHIYL
jgi:hypothetical protein